MAEAFEVENIDAVLLMDAIDSINHNLNMLVAKLIRERLNLPEDEILDFTRLTHYYTRDDTGKIHVIAYVKNEELIPIFKIERAHVTVSDGRMVVKQVYEIIKEE